MPSAKHARPGTPLAITEANICYEWDPKSYTPETRKLGPGTFYAAIWDADRMGVALEANLWTLAFWNLAEPVQMTNANVFGFILTDLTFSPMSINIVTVPDDAAVEHRLLEYTLRMADAGLPPLATH